MNDLFKWGGGFIAGLVMLAFAGLLPDHNVKSYVPATPAAVAPMSLSSDARCPSPPATGGAIFAEYGKGVTHADGNPKPAEYLNCDYAGMYSYVVDATGHKQLAQYKGDGSPRVWDTEGDIARVLADLR